MDSQLSEGAGSEIISSRPVESRKAVQLVLDVYGEPHEATASLLIWYRVGPWKRVVAYRTFFEHAFPAPHYDSVQSVIDYRVPPDKFTALAEYDGSVVVERTAGEVSARCHDEQANQLALNLMHDIVTGVKSAAEAKAYYAKEFLDYRRKLPTPYMDKLRFQPGNHNTADPDQRILSDKDLQAAVKQGEEKDRTRAG